MFQVAVFVATYPGTGVLLDEVLIGELLAVDGATTSSILSREVTYEITPG